MNAFLLKIWELAFDIKTVMAQGGGSPIGGGAGGGQTLDNPLGEGTTILGLLERITGYLWEIAVPIVTIFILYGAFQILTAAGDVKRVESGRKTILYAVIGFGVILIASGIPYILEEILTGG